MNKKKLIIAAIAAAISVTTANATNITGAIQSGNTFNIHPDQINGDVGYRKYTDFTLSAGDIANMVFSGQKNGSTRNLEAFVNLVQNGVNINGILNTVDGIGNFSNGHAIFITPGGLTIGESGVLNVGALSVATPTLNKFNELSEDYAVGNFTNINQISKLKQDSNAPIAVQGKIFARRGVDLRGSDIGITGTIVNGFANNPSQVLTSTADADALFSSLVNTDGVSFKSGTTMVTDGGMVLIKSSDSNSRNGIELSSGGKILNNGDGGTFLTNKGANGTFIEEGDIIDRTQITINNQDGNLVFSSGSPNSLTAPKVSIVNYGDKVEIQETTIEASKKLDIVNHGTGNMYINAKMLGCNDLDIVNNADAGTLTVDSNIGGSATLSTRIMNRGGKATIGGDIQSKNVILTSKSSDGMDVTGKIQGRNVTVHNTEGNLNISGSVENYVGTGEIVVYNEANGGNLSLASGGEILANNKLAIKNKGDGGMTLAGTITNTGKETAINNTDGELLISGSITNNGNMGIKNTGSGAGANADFTVSKDATITNNNGTLNIRNSGDNGMTIAGTILNDGTADTHDNHLYIYNDAGKLQFTKDTTTAKAASVTNTNGNLYIGGRAGSEGISAAAGTTISNANGELAIRNKGELVAEGTRGLDLQGSITNNGTALAINNDSGDMYVSGSVTAQSGNLGIINRAGAGSMELAKGGSVTTANGKQANIKNYGSGDMIVNSTINNNGRTNVIANSGALTLGSTLNNTSGALSQTGGFYTASRQNGKGINVTTEFVANNSTGEILIKNISGSQGLKYNGSISNNGYQAALVNKNGTFSAPGDVSATGNSVIFSNAGTGALNVSGHLSSDTEVKVVNTSSVKADISHAQIDAPNGRILYDINP